MRRGVLVTLSLALTPVAAMAAPSDKPQVRAQAGRTNPRAVQIAKPRVAARPKAQIAQPRLGSLREAERAGFKSVNTLTNGAFPPFFPSLGRVYVRPKTLPVGPFLTFDRQGRQVSTIYMISLEDMNGHKKFDAGGTRVPRVDHVAIYYNGGHPGVDFPHYHYVLWHVSKKEEARVAR